MDEASQNVAGFLESLQDAMGQLGEVWNHYLRRGARPERPCLVLSGRPFTIHRHASARQFHGSVVLGLEIHGADGREYELTVDVHWDSQRWTLQTEAWVASDAGGQELLRELPERTASDMHDCQRCLKEAVADLLGFQDLIPGTDLVSD